jgi:hypothetical protein
MTRRYHVLPLHAGSLLTRDRTRHPIPIHDGMTEVVVRGLYKEERQEHLPI